ncbi:MAG: hypothetical protein H7201_01930 [Candidatus Saccharibacteria bacterium]|nr:hypothetical protein [Microbacteriaceae bacterium]
MSLFTLAVCVTSVEGDTASSNRPRLPSTWSWVRFSFTTYITCSIGFDYPALRGNISLLVTTDLPFFST